MSFRQVLWPNLDNDPNNPLYVWIGGQILTDWYGWCLAVIAAAYGAQGSSYSAKTAWQACGTKHYDRDIPEYVCVPLWYEGVAYGHVVMGFRQGNSITIYSSPYTHMATFQRFDGELNWALDYVGQVYGVGSFTGWSETVLDSRVIEYVPETPPEPPEEPKNDETINEPSEPSETPSAPSDEPAEPNNEKGDDNMAKPEPVQGQDQQEIMSVIEEASKWIKIPNWLKVVAYFVGDTLLYAGYATPFVINMMQAENLTEFGTYLSGLLTGTGIYILMVFKLIKKGGKS